MNQKTGTDMTNQYKVIRDKPRIKNEEKLKKFLMKYVKQTDDSTKGIRTKP